MRIMMLWSDVAYFSEKYVRPIIERRRSNPLHGEAAKSDIISLMVNYRDENGKELSDICIEVL